MHKKVAIILVNYKDYAQKYLKECFNSLRAQNYPKELIQAYIIDNSSSVESLDYLKREIPEARIIPREDGNYAAANNAGLKKAINEGFEYLVMANMDVKFDENYLNELVKAIDSDSKIGIAQSKILLYPKNENEWKTPKINSLGNIMHFLGFGFTKGYGDDDTAIEGYPDINYASGCSYITKKDVIEKISGYNEEYYMYHDDIEISWKTRLAGYKIVLAPKSVIYHKYEFSRSIRMLYYMERNRYLVILTFYRIPTLILLLPAMIVMDIGMFFYSILNKWNRTLWKVYFYYLKPSSCIKIYKERKKVKKLRVVRDKDIIQNFSGKVEFQEIDNPVLKYIANPCLNLYWGIAKKIIWW
jgi:GT2 family glycosyltransferase